MSDTSPDSTPSELRVVLDVEFTVEGLASPVEVQNIEAVLVDVPGVQSISCLANTVAIRYDPEKVTKTQLADTITAAGLSVSSAASAPATPTVEPTNDTAGARSADHN